MALRLILFTTSLIFSTHGLAHGLWIGAGTSDARWHWEDMSRSKNGRIAFVYDMQPDWQWLEDYGLSMQMEAGYLYWEDEKWGDKNGVMLSPVFNYPITNSPIPLTFRFGIGASYRDGEQWADRKLGSRWLFEDRLELSAQLAPHHHLGLTYLHYSNAGLGDSNWGANILNLSYRYQW